MAKQLVGEDFFRGLMKNIDNKHDYIFDGIEDMENIIIGFTEGINANIIKNKSVDKPYTLIIPGFMKLTVKFVNDKDAKSFNLEILPDPKFEEYVNGNITIEDIEYTDTVKDIIQEGKQYLYNESGLNTTDEILWDLAKCLIEEIRYTLSNNMSQDEPFTLSFEEFADFKVKWDDKAGVYAVILTGNSGLKKAVKEGVDDLIEEIQATE